MKRGSTVRLALGSDTNNHEVIGHHMGTNNVNGNWILRDGEIINWAEATYQEREQMFQDQVDYEQGYFYYIAHDLLPAAQADPELQTAENEWAMEQIEKLATTVAQYGLDPNEFQTTGHWPHTLYVREARRMISEVVMTEHHHFRDEIVDDPVGLANYFADSHKVRRYLKDDKVFLEGDIPVERNFEPWGISYRSIIPAREEIQNLFVPWAISASKVAFCSMRMEPCFMVLSESAATAACLAIEEDVAVRDLSYDLLRARLIEDGQILPDLTGDQTIVDNADTEQVVVTGD
jgi:N-dimethylarginine dimethylaminohydrolase